MASAVDYHCPPWCNRRSKHAADRRDPIMEGIDWHTSRHVQSFGQWLNLSLCTDPATGKAIDGGVKIFLGDGTDLTPAQLRKHAAFLLELANKARP
ncbi:MAG TPA: hypothetical protein VHC43_09925 [Mycobacteriales bacterium]|nr:hypothetical protein [Mycobacteriales bacterium]